MAGLTLFLLAGCGNDTGSASAGAYNAYLTQRGELQNTVTASGTVEGSDAFSITSDGSLIWKKNIPESSSRR